MRIVRKVAFAAVGLSTALVAAPALATANTYVFASNSNTTSLTVDGGTMGFTGSVKNPVGSVIPTITATVSAWNATKLASDGTTLDTSSKFDPNKPDTYAVRTAKLGIYGGGLGVTSDKTDNFNGNGAGDLNQHQIDNLGNSLGTTSIDFVQIVFSKAVTLSGISQYAYSQPDQPFLFFNRYLYDDDFSYGRGTSQAALANTPGATSGAFTVDTTRSAAQLAAMLNNNGGSDGLCNGSTSGNDYCYDVRTGLNKSADQYSASTVWWISAALLNPDCNSDAFKLYDFTVVYNDAPVTIASVPEPASWTMMIGGFGLIGGALRRKKAAERLAAA